MKSIAGLLMIMALSCLGIKAQKPIAVIEDSLNFGKSRLPGVTVIIPEADYETILKSWTKELKSVTKLKPVVEQNEVSVMGAKFKNIDQPVNVYSKLIDLDSSLMLTVAFELKKDVYIDKTQETDLTNAKKYLRDFAKNEYIAVVDDQFKAEEKKLNDLQKQLSSLEKEKTRFQKDIQSDSTTIFTENENLKIQRNELETVSSEIVEQNKQLSSPESDALKKEKNDYLNGLEKRRKKALNSIESSQSKIDKANNDILKAKGEIPKNERLQEELKEKVEVQEGIYQKYSDKLKTIKAY
jgi:hypothetical protein